VPTWSVDLLALYRLNTLGIKQGAQFDGRMLSEFGACMEDRALRRVATCAEAVRSALFATTVTFADMVRPAEISCERACNLRALLPPARA